MRSVRVQMILDTLRAVKGANDFRTASDKVGDSLAKTAAAGEAAGKAVDGAGGQMSDAARAAAKLDREIDNLTGDLRQMATAQALTGENFSKQIREQEASIRRLTRQRKLLGDVGTDMASEIGGSLNKALQQLDLRPIDVTADPRSAMRAIEETEERLRKLSRDSATVEVKVRTEKALGELGRFRRQLGDVGEDAATGFVAKFVGRLGPLMASAPLEGMAPVGAALAVAIGPSLAAGIGAAIAGGIGIGAIGAGIALAVKDDDELQSVAKTIGRRFAANLGAEAAAFKQPLLRSLADIDAFAARSVPKIGRIFQDQAPLINNFTRQLLRGGDALTDAFVNASARSGPALRSIGGLVENVTGAVGDMITTLSQNSAAGASAIDDLSMSLVNLIRTTTGTLDGLAKIKGGLDQLDAAIDKSRYWLEDHTRTVDYTADGYKKGSEAAELYRKGIIGVAGSANDYTAYLARVNTAQTGVNLAMEMAIPTADDLTKKQKELTQIQQSMAASLSLITVRQSGAQLRATTLRQAMDGLYGATMKQADANVAYQASWDGLTDSVKQNKRSLDIHTAAGRSNRQALVALIGSTNEAYLADIAAGTAIDGARKKHDARIRSIEKEAGKLGLNKKATQELISTYGRIPPKRTTDLLLSGVGQVVKYLKELYIFQRALAEGIPIASARAAANERSGPAKRYGGFDTGGWTGPGPRTKVAGVVHADEYVVSKPARRQLESAKPGALDYMNTTGRWPGYLTGGQVAPVDESRRWPFVADAGATKIPSRSQVASKVAGGTGYKWMEAAARRAFPYIAILSDYRPGARTLSGNVSYHALGRAVDFEPSRPLAEWINAKYKGVTKELISPWNDLNILNGRRHHYTGAIYNQHNFAGGNAHVHWAKDGYGSGGGSGVTLNITFTGPVGSQYELRQWLTAEVDTLKRAGRI